MRLNYCRNPSLGFTTKARACKGAGQEEARESHLMLPSVRECEGINPHTPKGAPILGVGIMVNFQREILRVKTQWIEEFIISLESS